METKVATALVEGSAADCAAKLAQQLTRSLEGQEPRLTLLFASTKQPLAQLMPAVTRSLPGVVLGSSTAGEFTEARDSKGGVAAVSIAGDFKVSAGLGRELTARGRQAVAEAARNLPTQEAGYPHRTAIMLMDVLGGKGEEAVESAASLLGRGIRLAGGAAGDDLAMKKGDVACGNQVSHDAVVLATLHSKHPLGVGVHHGHHPLSKPMTVTRAETNVVTEIDGRPAWDVWRERTREDARRRGLNPDKLSPDQIGGYLLQYEAALSAGGEIRVRAPLSKGADGSIAFACPIPQGSAIRITESTPERQISSARAAARLARQQMGNRPSAGAVVFDCICRNLFLGPEFQKAVRGISEELGTVPLAGFETYGEIALDAGDLSGFHNTTTVVLTLPR